MFKGYKTYITAVVAVVGAVAAVAVGDISIVDAAQIIVPAIIGAFVHNAVVSQ